MDDERPWWDGLYDADVADLFLDRDGETLHAQVSLLRELLQLDGGGRVFDQCCGIGSLSLALAAEGLSVVGVDWSVDYVRRARDAAEARGLEADYVAGDGCAFVPKVPCDAAFNWGTSFGNATEDAQNLRMAARAFEALKPGGRYLVEYPNMAALLAGFQTCMVRRKDTAAGSLLAVRESRLDLAAGILHQTWTLVTPRGMRARPTAVRLYMPHELAGMLASAGFCNIAVCDGIHGRPLQAHDARCVVMGVKP